jgi:hypothetical protein
MAKPKMDKKPKFRYATLLLTCVSGHLAGRVQSYFEELFFAHTLHVLHITGGALFLPKDGILAGVLGDLLSEGWDFIWFAHVGDQAVEQAIQAGQETKSIKDLQK